MNSSDENAYYRWFNEIEPEYWFGLSADKEHTLPKERSFLYKLGIMSSRGKIPSIRQLKWADEIVDRVEQQKTAERTHKQMERNKELSNPSDIRHITVRMAWHDNNWNGRICHAPEKNDYCIGEYSLLSRRIRQRRKLEKEIPDNCADMNALDGYIPPCYWSINAFGCEEICVEHEHPMLRNKNIKGTPTIPESLPNHSLFTWPFKLSFTRQKRLSASDGVYPKNLEWRIKKFFSKMIKKQSIVFLYCNYDNPISGDDQKYLIVGCAFLRDKGQEHFYKIPEDGLNRLRNKENYQNFPTISWDFRLSLDLESIVKIPYHEYLKDAEETNNFDLLNEIKIIVDEPALIQSFKYVAMDIDDDQAIYLLTKIKRSILRVREHGRFTDVYDADQNINRVETLLKHAWQKRGLFPGFLQLSTLLLDRVDDVTPIKLSSLIRILKECSEDDYCDNLIDLLEKPETDKSLLKLYKDEIYELKEVLATKKISIDDFLRLCLLNLTTEQFKRILNGKLGTVKRNIKDICHNPYILYEEYEAEEEAEDIITGELIDKPIELSKIDIAYFPDTRYLSRYHKLQSLQQADPRRIRALVISYLRGLEGCGDCFDDAKRIENVLSNYPLFYKSEYILPDDVLVNPEENTRNHYEDKLVIINESNRYFYYLKEIYQAEQFVAEKIKYLLSLQDLNHDFALDISSSVENLKKSLGERFDESEFKREHSQLYENVFSKRLFILSGSPGTGKSYELLQIVNRLGSSGEDYLILTPTGKATLRLTLNEENIADIKAQTIDKFLWEHQEEADASIGFENLIIDEMSMVDLVKFEKLLRKLDFNTIKFKRLILVGDENQLPPIGFGKVYIDIIRYILADGKYKDNFISLDVNCRQKLDDTVIKFAKVYSGQSKNHEVLLARALREGEISKGLHIVYWKNREELRAKLKERFIKVFKDKIINDDLNLALNKVFNLYDSGYVNNENHTFYERLNLDNFQIITPYRTAYYGALGLNNYIQQDFRNNQTLMRGLEAPLKHSDKIIQTKNVYRKKDGLILSNGSIGVVVNKEPPFYFPECRRPLKWLDNEYLELAYAITVHKAQGSGFEHVFFVLPAKKGLLSRELVYTALTRSRQGITIFTYGEPNQKLDCSLFEQIRTTSSVDLRKTSLLGQPYWEYTLSPKKNVNVKSRIEYIIYKKLQSMKEEIGEFEFGYEELYPLPWNDFDIKPDFTITLANKKKIFWEHLGRLGNRSYENDWKERLKIFKKEDKIECLVTTDERRGIDDKKIEQIILDIASDSLKSDVPDRVYSNHHYFLS
ncbi:MAG: AAA family ATPase [Salinivirgaceae bacterium]|nr:AAA family ATPase [Salinivirgaceae bacterium]